MHTALTPAFDAGELNVIADGRKNIGERFGAILRAALKTAQLRRAAIAAGDSSSHALGHLDIYALTARKPLNDICADLMHSL